MPAAKTIYLDENDQVKALETAKKLKKKGVYGLFKADGSLNLSALVQYFLKNSHKLTDSDQK